MILTFTHFHVFCGAGGGALGFNAGAARVGTLQARWKCLGGVDSDPAACRDFTRLVGTPATCLDLFDRQQYRAFHGKDPPPGYKEAMPADLRAAAGGVAPDFLFSSPPCKGFSGLLSTRAAASPKYQALNGLVTRGLWLALEAWADDPPAFVLIENVPRIQQRGRELLNTVQQLLRRYGYATAETAHDCGELGGLAQHRRRFLLVARHQVKVPAFLYEPPQRRVRAVGEVLRALPVPGTPHAERVGPMHHLPKLQWDTWVRLALIPAGGDWRALRGLDLGQYGLVRMGEHSSKMRVEPWTEPAHTVTGSDRVGSGAPSVGDPRWGEYQQLGVRDWKSPSGAVTAQAAPGSGPFSVADPRCFGGGMGVAPWDEPGGTVTGEAYPSNGRFSVADPRWHRGVLGVVSWDGEGSTVTGRAKPSTGAFSVGDPRLREGRFNNVCRVVRWDTPSVAVTGGGHPSSGGPSVADPRPWEGAGHYGIVSWEQPSGAVTAAGGPDNGRGNVADPRLGEVAELPLIVSLDGTWHRPFTTLELAALQGFPVDNLRLDGASHSRWRERIGNAVPPPSAQAVASVMGTALLLSRSGQTFALGGEPIWVQRLAAALSVAQ